MAIDFDGARAKVNELNQTAVKVVDILAILERGAIIVPPPNSVTLTATQIAQLKLNVKTLGDNLKTIAGEIKNLVTE